MFCCAVPGEVAWRRDWEQSERNNEKQIDVHQTTTDALRNMHQGPYQPTQQGLMSTLPPIHGIVKCGVRGRLVWFEYACGDVVSSKMFILPMQQTRK